MKNLMLWLRPFLCLCFVSFPKDLILVRTRRGHRCLMLWVNLVCDFTQDFGSDLTHPRSVVSQPRTCPFAELLYPDYGVGEKEKGVLQLEQWLHTVENSVEGGQDSELCTIFNYSIQKWSLPKNTLVNQVVNISWAKLLKWIGKDIVTTCQDSRVTTLQWSSLRNISILLEGIWPAQSHGLWVDWRLRREPCRYWQPNMESKMWTIMIQITVVIAL